MAHYRVLIGIPTLNGNHRLLRCLKSIFEGSNTNMDGVCVLVADDGSTDEQVKLNKDVISQCPPDRGPRVEMLYGHGRTGIAKTWNRLCRFHDSDICVLVNDDIEVVPHWLEVLEYSLRANAHVGMVGLNSYLAVTKVQAQLEGRPPPLMVDYWESELTRHRHCNDPGCDVDAPHVHAKLQNGGGNLIASTGSCFAFRREYYNAVGGFDERYFCFFEEVDFGAELQRRGYWNYMASYPLVYHTGGETNSNPENLRANERIAESRDLFQAKWGKTPSDLRGEFAARGAGPACRTWNTMLRNLT